MNASELIGGSPIRQDSAAKVTGAALYPDDLEFDGMLYASVLRSPHPHARVRSIDLESARQAPGVAAAVSGDNIRGANLYGLITPDQPALARTGGKVRFVGEAVAAVAASTARIAKRATELIEVDYELLPVVSDPRLATEPESVLVHEDCERNILHSVRIRHGDIVAGFQAADVIVAGRYTCPFVEHAYMQPESGIAAVGADGRVTIWVATQWPDQDRREIAHALGLPLEQIRLVVPTTGGAFGGREDISVQIVLALLAIETGRPVKLTYSRSESLIASTKRHPFDMVYRTGATLAGKLCAMEIELVANAGAYASTSLVVLNTASTLATGPYEVPNVALDGRVVYTNAPATAAMRGFGANQPAFAVEIQMSKLAAALEMDPAAFRRMNLYRNGSTMLTGQVLRGGVGVVKSLDAAMQQAERDGMHWGQHRADGHKRYGVGIGCGFKNVGFSLGFDDHSGATVEAYPDRAIVRVGAIDVGQGSNIVMAQLAASKLELPLSAIQVISTDTDVVPEAGSSSASRHTYVTGNAVLRAADEAAQRLSALGPNPPQGSLPVVATAIYHASTTVPLDPVTGQSENPNITYGYGTQAVEIEVDTETGEVRVLRVIAAHDVGRAIHAQNVEGQIEGGYLMGQGYSLLEEYVLKDGKPITTTMATTLIPTSLDAPSRLVALIVEEPDPDGPYGAKGLGEMTMLPTPGAIAAAIHDAIGVWLDDLPMTPERVLRALGEI